MSKPVDVRALPIPPPLKTNRISNSTQIELPTLIELSPTEFTELEGAVIERLREWRESATPPEKGFKSNPTNPLNAERVKDELWIMEHAILGDHFYCQLFFKEESATGKSNPAGVEHPFVSFTDYFRIIGDAQGRIVGSMGTIRKQCFVVAVVGLVYGGLHLVAWNNYFPSVYEAWGWRVCSLITMASAVGVVSLQLVGLLVKPATGASPSSDTEGQSTSANSTGSKKSNLSWLYCWFCGIMFGFGVFVALLARMFMSILL